MVTGSGDLRFCTTTLRPTSISSRNSFANTLNCDPVMTSDNLSVTCSSTMDLPSARTRCKIPDMNISIMSSPPEPLGSLGAGSLGAGGGSGSGSGSDVTVVVTFGSIGIQNPPHRISPYSVLNSGNCDGICRADKKYCQTWSRTCSLLQPLGTGSASGN